VFKFSSLILLKLLSILCLKGYGAADIEPEATPPFALEAIFDS